MLRSIIALAVVAAAHAAVWPEQFQTYRLKSEQPVSVSSDKPVWDELGLESAVQADYEAFRAAAYRFKDSTDAYAAYHDLFSGTPNAVAMGNYVVTCEGRCPKMADFGSIAFPRIRRSQYPTLSAYLPRKALIANSERYAVGPATLQKVAPEIPGKLAMFDLGTEVQEAAYRNGKGEQKLVLFSFATPQLARQQAAEFEKLGGTAVKRSGPIVAVLTDATDRAFADRLLAAIQYQATVSWDEKPKPKVTVQSVAQMIVTIFELAGVLLLFCVAAGLAFAGLRVARKRLGHESADGAMIVLHLVDR